MGWPKSPFSFLYKNKTHFSFSLITLLIWMFWVCRQSSALYNVDFSQLMSNFDQYQLQLVYLTVEHRPVRNLRHKTSQTTFDTFDQSQHRLHTLHKSFLVCFSCIFTFLETIKHNMLKVLLIFFHLQYLKWLHKNSPILMFSNARWCQLSQ